MSLAITILSVLQVIGALLMLLIILMQRPKQEGLGASFGANMTQDLFGAQTTNVLQKATAYLAVFFFINTLVIAILITRADNAAKDTSGLESAPAAIEETVAPAETATPAADEVPAAEAPAPAVDTPAAPAAEVPAEAVTPAVPAAE